MVITTVGHISWGGLGFFGAFYCILVVFRDELRSELCKRHTPMVREDLKQESDPFISAGLPLTKVQIQNPRSSWRSSNASCSTNSVGEASLWLWWDEAMCKA